MQASFGLVQCKSIFLIKNNKKFYYTLEEILFEFSSLC